MGELFKALYSEYPGEDQLFDTNRLYTVQARDEDLFQNATRAFQAYLEDAKAVAEREALARARTEEMLQHDQRKKRVEPQQHTENGA